jgi:hypothetical protein
MSAPTGFGTEGLRGVIARDFALLAILGVDSLDGVNWFYDKAWFIAEATSPDLVQALLEETKCPR